MADRIFLPRATDANNAPVPAAVARFYAAGTTTPLTVYTDDTLGTARGTTDTANASGYFGAAWVAAGTDVKVIYETPAGAELPSSPGDDAGRFSQSADTAADVAFVPITENTATNVQAAIAQAGGTAKVSSDDTTGGFLGAKIVAGAGIAVAQNNGGDNETLSIAATVLDEDDMASDSATRAPSQQSVVAYVGTRVGTYGATIATDTGATAYDFTGIPTTVREIDLVLDGVALSGTDFLLVQIGAGGSPAVSGYAGRANLLTASATNGTGFTTAFGIRASGVDILTMRLRRSASGNIWVSDHSGASATATLIGAGTVTLAGPLNMLRVTRSGTDTFTAGAAWLRYAV